MEQHRIESPGDWMPYLDQIRSLYIDEDRTLNDIREYMKATFGVTATVNQYKKLFTRQRWSKNATRSQWIEIGQAIAKRKQDGKETRVLIHGKAVDPKKLKRELDRYQEDIITAIHAPGLGDADDGIVLRTPSPQIPPRQVPENPANAPSNNMVLSPRLHEQDTRGSPQRNLQLPYLQVAASAALPNPASSPTARVSSSSMINFNPGSLSYFDATFQSRCSTPSFLASLEHPMDDDVLLTCGFAFDTLQDALLKPNISYIIVSLELAAASSKESPTHRGSSSIPDAIFHSWSLDSLRLVVSESLQDRVDGVSMELQHVPVRIQSASAFQLLDIAVCAVTIMANRKKWFDFGTPSVCHQLLAWFADSRHIMILEKLAMENTSLLRVFLKSFIAATIQTVCYPSSVPVPDATSSSNKLLLDVALYLEKNLHDNEPISQDDLSLFSTAVSANEFAVCNMLLRRGLRIRPEKLVRSAIYQINPKALGFLLQLWNRTDRHMNGNGSWHTGGRINSLLGLPFLRLFRSLPVAQEEDFEAVIRILLNHFAYEGLQFGKPCWEIFSPLDLRALVDSRVSKTVAQLLRDRGARDGGVARIIKSAKVSGQGHLRSTALGMDDTEFTYHLEAALWGAVYAGNVELARVLLLSGAHPDCAAVVLHARSASPHRLCHAFDSSECRLKQFPIECASRNPTMTRLLIEAGAVQLSDFIRRRLPYSSTDSRQWYRSWLLKHDTARRFPREILELASLWADHELFAVIDARLTAGDPSREVELEQLALEYSFSHFDLGTSQRLLDRGCQFEEPDVLGRCLVSACEAASPWKVKFLLNLGAPPNFNNGPRGNKRTPLQAVLSIPTSRSRERRDSSITSIAEYLLSAGADPNVASRVPGDALHLSCIFGHLTIVKLLIQAGANLTIGNPLLDAYRSHSTDIIETLVAAYADQKIDIKPQATAALEALVPNNCVSDAIGLLKLGADVNSLGSRCGPRPLWDIGGVCEIQFGGNGARFCPCASPVERAAALGQFDMVKLFINAGAEGFSVTSPPDYDELFLPPESGNGGSVGDLSELVDGLGHAFQAGEGNRTTGSGRFKRALRLAESRNHTHVAELLRRHQ